MLGRVSVIHLHQLTHQRTKRYHFKKWSYVLQISAQIFDHLFIQKATMPKVFVLDVNFVLSI